MTTVSIGERVAEWVSGRSTTIGKGTVPLAYRLAHVTDPRLAGVLEQVAALAGRGGAATPGAVSPAASTSRTAMAR